ncbi:hypothetical protein LPB248_06280 [Flavobacterium sp. LPB0248]|uniref:hypothetical protein n=1 Tax=Flavobacterium sp. LPB0248 TaxID=2614441 RepID=UPI0015A5E285|nr:hypothetical protein [Flavobacterium sp. LPB0248]QLC65905.1 hypothetical protein LPB248_06280 [Flavobacterium sp. LPB0248]
MMRKITTLFCMSLLIFTSCSSEDNSSQNTETSRVPKKQIISSVNAPVTIDFVFDGNKIVSSTHSGNYVVKYTYTGDLITKKESSDLTNEYNYTNGKLTTYLRKLTGRDYYDKYSYTYESNDVVSFVVTRITISTGAEEVISAKNIYTLKNGNIIKYETSSSVITYKYDNKNNPMRNILGFNKIFEEQPQVSSSVNNVTSYTVTLANNSSYTNEITYTYDDNNFPTVINNKALSSISTYSY